VLYTRWFRHGRRWVGRAESQDFLRWGPIEPVLWPNMDATLDHDIYLNAYSRYPELPQYHLMFAMHYYRSTERSDVHLYSSDDGIAWQHIPGSPVLTPGVSGAWDSEFVAGGKDLLQLTPDRMGIPYIGTSYPHKYPRWPEVFAAWKTGWAWWPTDRLCSVRADEDGRFRTLPLKRRGSRVLLNYRTRRAGSVRIGVVGVEGRTTERCIPLHGDETDRVVTWHGGSTITGSEGTPVILDVELRAAELFSIRLE